MKYIERILKNKCEIYLFIKFIENYFYRYIAVINQICLAISYLFLRLNFNVR